MKQVEPNQALIAIQIVNGESSSSGKGKNSKRTIESSLGYGRYQDNNFVYKSQDGKFEIYPYSQRDIPPSYYPKSKHPNVEIQPADSYVVGKTHGHGKHQTQYQQHYSSNYQQQQQPSYHSYQNSKPSYQDYPNMLFSTITKGQIGDVSPHIPTQFIQYPVSDHSGQQLQVPVIILRVYSDQLSHANELYPNLPASNPYASYLNMINLQSLLSQYDPSHYQQNQYEQPLTQTHYQEPSHVPLTENFPLSENYPSEAHTKVIIPPKKSNKYYKSSTKLTPSTHGYYKTQTEASHGYSYQTQTEASHAGGYAYETQTEASYDPSAYAHPSYSSYSSQAPQASYASQEVQYPRGNEYSVPVPEAQNYYSQAEQPQTSTETQYLYLHEKDIGSNGGGYVYQDPTTGQLMYMPHQMESKYAYQEQQYQTDPKALLYTREPEQQYTSMHVTSGYTASHQTESTSTASPHEHKVHNYHAQSPRSAGKKIRSSRPKSSTPLVLAPKS